jgi:hypothetical protein
MVSGVTLFPLPVYRLAITSPEANKLYILTKQLLAEEYVLSEVNVPTTPYDVDFFVAPGALEFLVSSPGDQYASGIYGYDFTLPTIVLEDRLFADVDTLRAIKTDPEGFLYVAGYLTNRVYIFSNLLSLRYGTPDYLIPRGRVDVGLNPGVGPHGIDLSYPCDEDNVVCYNIGQK